MSILPLSTIDWQRAVSCVLLGQLQPVHDYENWCIHSPTTTVRVPAIVISRGPYVLIKRQVSHRFANAFLRDDYTCQYCGSSTVSPTADHVIPKSKKGSSQLTNISTACVKCNNKKGNNENIRPSSLPYMPSYNELVRKTRRRPITIPHLSWSQYIGWDEKLVLLKEPFGMPGYLPSNT